MPPSASWNLSVTATNFSNLTLIHFMVAPKCPWPVNPEFLRLFLVNVWIWTGKLLADRLTSLSLTDSFFFYSDLSKTLSTYSRPVDFLQFPWPFFCFFFRISSFKKVSIFFFSAAALGMNMKNDFYCLKTIWIVAVFQWAKFSISLVFRIVVITHSIENLYLN